ncbi:MAG: hypothetical protein WBZ36_07520 [Candidatus Nitrosopolaris sp.]
MTQYSTSHEIERGMRDGKSGGERGVMISTSISYDPRTTVVGEPSWGQTLEDFYRIHNLDEKRRKYLEDLRSQVNNLPTGGPLNNLLSAMGLDYRVTPNSRFLMVTVSVLIGYAVIIRYPLLNPGLRCE